MEKILEDFKSGKASHAPFWIQMKGKFILKVIAPFVPVPLLDKTTSLGFRHWVDEKGENRVDVYFRK